jgi:hypothetical protein
VFGFLTDWKVFNFNQILSLFLMSWGAWRIAHIVPSPLSEWIIDIGEQCIKYYEVVLKHLHSRIKQVRRWWKNR